uniref:Uncharacterized protein n=1 Tax=Plectus sambesii TaxID=2011161 RepID=A0A914V2C9_9BILA
MASGNIVDETCSMNSIDSLRGKSKSRKRIKKGHDESMELISSDGFGKHVSSNWRRMAEAGGVSACSSKGIIEACRHGSPPDANQRAAGGNSTRCLLLHHWLRLLLFGENSRLIGRAERLFARR